MHPFFRNMRHRATVILTVLIVCAIASLIFSGMIGSIAIPVSYTHLTLPTNREV